MRISRHRLGMPTTFSRQAFSLAELLAVILILSVMMLAMTRLFTASVRAWSTSSNRVENANKARAALDFMERELSSAIADDKITFRLNGDSLENRYGERFDEIHFVALNEIPDGSEQHRTARQISYAVTPIPDTTNRFRLVRSMRNEFSTTNGFEPYLSDWTDPTPSLFPAGGMLIDNIVGFEVRAFTNTAVTAVSSESYFSGDNNNELPIWVDLYVEVLSEKDALLAAELADGAAEDFAERFGQGFFTRAQFNQRGY